MYLIAEIGTNHNGVEAKAFRLVAAAAKTGVQAIKMNYWKADSLVHPSSNWYDRCKQLELEFGTLETCRQICQQYHKDFILAPWSAELVSEADELADKFKVASGELTNDKLLSAIYDTGVTSLLSTGMATNDEISKAVDILEPDVVMHCVSLYPCPINKINIKRINKLKKIYYDRQIGYSSHTVGHLDKVAAFCMGANVIEFHFNIPENECVDEKVSLYSENVEELISMLKMIEQMEINSDFADYFMRDKLRRNLETELRR
jgi:sialic acid synthase SpsE